MKEIINDYIIGKEAIEYVEGDLNKYISQNKISDIKILKIGNIIGKSSDLLLDFLSYLNYTTFELSKKKHKTIIEIVNSNLKNN